MQNAASSEMGFTSQISLSFGIQQPTVVSGATTDFVSKIKVKISLMSESTCRVFVPTFHMLIITNVIVMHY
jgi:hypothetical protein